MRKKENIAGLQCFEENEHIPKILGGGMWWRRHGDETAKEELTASRNPLPIEKLERLVNVNLVGL
jgi:hypothetical protein